MRTIETDALIIGSGFGGSAPALRLAQAGCRVTVIEKGPSIDPARDFRQTQDPKYLLRYLKGISGKHLSLTYAEALGGGSGFYEMVSLRAPSIVFEQRDEKNRMLWPGGVDREAMNPYYDRAEKMLHVEQIPQDEVPRTGLVFSYMMKRLGYSCDRARYAVRGCTGSGFCVTGCIFGAKQSLFLNYLPQAEKAGAEIMTDLEAESIRTLMDVRETAAIRNLRETPYRYEVICQSRQEGGERIRFRSRLLLLAGGTVGTAELLLRSREHLRFLGGNVGRHIAFNGSVKVAALLPDEIPDGDMFTGRSHPGMVSYQFLESHGVMVTAAKPLPLQAVAAARLHLDGDSRNPSYWGEANAELMKKFRRRVIVLAAFGMTAPQGRIRRGHGGKYALSLDVSGELRAYHERTKSLLHSILTRNGCRLIDVDFVDREGMPRKDLHFSTTHQLGSCRMADSKKMGVVDRDCEAFDYPGLYVTDGSALPTSLAVNSSLTILANAERVSDRIVEKYALDNGVVAHDS